jgi:D-amino-acid dehydrogenase
MTDEKTVAVIGAGIVGVSTAVWLQRDGHKVVLIDKEGPAGGASYGNAGVIVPSGVIPINSPGLIRKAPGMLIRRSSPLFLHWSYLPKMLPWLLRYLARANEQSARQVANALRPLLSDSVDQHHALAQGTGAEKWIKAADYVFVYDSPEAFRKDDFAWSVRRELGIDWDEFDAEEFADYDPAFGHIGKFAIRLPNHARITDPGRYVTDLAKHVQQKGGEMITAQAQDIVTERSKVRAVKTDRGLVDCEVAIIAAGAWSKSLAEKQGIKLPMESERGYHIDLINPSVTPRTVMMLTSGKFVIAPMEGRIRCAGIVEFGGLKAPSSKAPLDLLKAYIQQTCPNLEYDSVEEWMGHRPAPADSIPFIGRFDDTQNLYAAFGHHHVGLTGGAKTGRIIADMIANRDLDIDMKPYRASRFTH